MVGSTQNNIIKRIMLQIYKFKYMLNCCKNYQVLLLLLLCGIAAGYQTFAEYKQAFSKTYEADQQSQRKTYYENTVTAAEALSVPFMIAENQFWDRSPEQLAKLSRSTKISGTTFNQFSQFKTGGNQEASVEDITEKNWKTDNKVTGVKAQGPCGSSWAFSVAAMSESSMILKQSQTYDFAEQGILQCTSQSSCDGGYVEKAIQLSVNKGLPLESKFPYDPLEKVSRICEPQEKIFPSQNYFVFQNLSDTQILGLLKYGPVVSHVSAQNWIYYSSGIFQCQENSAIAHSALIVGVTSSQWILKNSWGTNWGEDGYIRISRDTKKNCGIGSMVFALSESMVIQTHFLLLIMMVLWTSFD